MKISATTLLLAAALGVSAHPSGHVHRHLHRSNDGSRFYKSTKPHGIPVDKVNVVNADAHVAGPDSAPTPSYQAPPPPPPPAYSPKKPAPTKHEEPSPTGSGSESGQDNGLGISTPEDLCQGNKQKRATLAEIVESGNTGGDGSNFGCNVKMVHSSLVEKYPKKYPYTIKLNNVGDRDHECACFLKKGKDGQPNSGSFKNQELFKFKLAANKFQYVAAAKDSKLTCTCSPNQLECNGVGQWGGTWIESDFASSTNSKSQGELWSGADASCITASMSQLDIPGMRVYRQGSPDQASIVCPKAGPNSKNAYLGAADVAKDGVGLNIRTQGDEAVRLVADVDHQHGC